MADQISVPASAVAILPAAQACIKQLIKLFRSYCDASKEASRVADEVMIFDVLLDETSNAMLSSTHERLDEALFICLSRAFDDLSSLENVLAIGADVDEKGLSVAQKVSWVLRRGTTLQHLERLKHCRTTLVLLLNLASTRDCTILKSPILSVEDRPRPRLAFQHNAIEYDHPVKHVCMTVFQHPFIYSNRLIPTSQSQLIKLRKCKYFLLPQRGSKRKLRC